MIATAPIENRIRIKLIPGGIVFGGERWIGELRATEFLNATNVEPRIEVKFSNNKPWRKVLIYDSLGIYTVEDIADGRISYLGIALIPEETPFPTQQAFSGELLVNGVTLIAGMKPRALPLRGEMNFVPGIGTTWKYVHDNSYVELNLKNIKKSGRPATELVLVSVTHSFLKN